VTQALGVELRTNTETHVLLFEPRTTDHTGNVVNDRTVAQPDRI
jgi:hypothetical protein